MNEWKNKRVKRLISLIANIEVEVSAESVVLVIGIDVLQPAVKELMEVVEVILASAAARPSRGGCSFNREAAGPTIVPANAQEHITAIISQKICKEPGASSDVEIGVSAVTTRCSTTFILSDLHQSLFTSSTDSVWLARAFLQRKGCQHDRRDTELTTVGLKEVKERSTCLERAVPGVDCRPQGLDFEIRNLNIRRLPSSTLNTTIQPIKATIGSRCGGSFSSSSGVATVGLNINNVSTTGVLMAVGRGIAIVVDAGCTTL
jgi:hypothetical protein